MADVNLNVVVRDLVAGEIEHALEPYQSVLSRLSQFLGSDSNPFSLARSPRAGALHSRSRRTAASANGRGDASAFKLGQTVSYRQGRGTFEALVTEIDAATGTLMLQRKADGKSIARPASKVLA